MRDPYVPWPSVVVSGYSAHVFATVLRKHLPGEVRQFAEPRQAEALAGLSAVERAADAWRVLARATASAARGNAAVPAASLPPASDQITTEELARVLGVKPRQARNVGAQHGLGELVGKTWVWSHAAALAYLEERRTA